MPDTLNELVYEHYYNLQYRFHCSLHVALNAFHDEKKLSSNGSVPHFPLPVTRFTVFNPTCQPYFVENTVSPRRDNGIAWLSVVTSVVSCGGNVSWVSEECIVVEEQLIDRSAVTRLSHKSPLDTNLTFCARKLAFSPSS